MEYANLHTQHHHHQLQEQVNIGVPSASLPIIAPTTVVTTTTSNCNWNPSLILNNGIDVFPTEANIPNSKLWQSNSPITTSTFTSHEFNYGDHHARAFSTQRSSTASTEESPLSNIKEEPNSDSFSKLKIDKAIYKQQNENNSTFMELMSTTNSSYNSAPNELYSNIAQNNSINRNASFGHVFTSTNTNSTSSTAAISTTTGSLFPISLVLSSGAFMNNNSQALDLLSHTAYRRDRSQCYSPSSQHSNNSNIGCGLYRDQPLSVKGHGHHNPDNMQESRSSPSNSSNNNMTSAFFNEVTRTKRPSSFSEPKESHVEANKKSKSILRSSNPPLKVRKEKLGDRIAALHRLVAPFGKTDTASVLTEAIGYIQFLHDQVQTLSMPYMKSLQSKTSRKIQQVYGLSKEEETELKMDLRSRGLCLVPQSCASYLNGFD